MNSLHKNFNIAAHTTFGIEAQTAEFVSVESITSLKENLRTAPKAGLRVLGGGSNMLWTQDFPGRTIHVNLKGIRRVSETNQSVIIEVQAGENWHDLVLWTIENQLAGIENLALIPGNVGAAPIQNIGAYGVELKDVLVQCSVIYRSDLSEQILSVVDCKLGYRDSIFKNELRDKVVITAVQFRLKKPPHAPNTAYGSLEQELKGKPKNIEEVAQAVIRIRERKLPNPKEIGNCGSFFKNPVVSKTKFESLQNNYPTLPSYPVSEGVKIPAAWLIDQLGYKGLRRGDAGVHPHQALVLVNYGQASGAEIWALAEEIQTAVFKKYDILLENEVTRY